MFLNLVISFFLLFIVSIKCNPLPTDGGYPSQFQINESTRENQKELKEEHFFREKMPQIKGPRGATDVSKEEEMMDVLFRLFKSCKSTNCKLKVRQLIVRLVGEYVWDIYTSHSLQNNSRHLEKDFFNIRY
jgi:hypothetical protein